MPMGSKHLISGIIEQRETRYIFLPDDGGYWELDSGWRMHGRLKEMVGRHIMIEGERIGFNALYVEKLWQI